MVEEYEQEVGDAEMSYDSIYDWITERAMLYGIELKQIEERLIMAFNTRSRLAYHRLFGHL